MEFGIGMGERPGKGWSEERRGMWERGAEIGDHRRRSSAISNTP